MALGQPQMYLLTLRHRGKPPSHIFRLALPLGQFDQYLKPTQLTLL